MSSLHPNPEVVVETHGLSKRYGALFAVRELDMQVPRGAVFGLLGPNGAGKSTTFGILCGWLKPTSGSARLLGMPSQRLHRLAGRVAALPQDALFSPQMPVREELIHYARLGGMAAAAAGRDADRVLDLVGLREAKSLRGGELSHGMHKRIGLAQALLGRPEIVFLDEPTSGLDPKIARHIKDLIASLAPTTTVVLSSHNLAEVEQICTHGAILDHGRLVQAGSIAELTAREEEVSIEVGALERIPWAALREAFGAAAVSELPRGLRLRLKKDDSAGLGTNRALRLLLDAEVPVLAVQRGTSLETAFLRITS